MRSIGTKLKAIVARMVPRRRSADARAIDRENRHRARLLRAKSGAPPHHGTFTSGGPGGVF